MPSNKKQEARNKRQEELQQRIDELTDALKRERADAENIRRRHNEEILRLNTLVKASVVSELLPVIDNFERALKHVPKDLEKNDFVKGVNGIVKQFEDTLAGMGVERIKTVGEVFDPQLHEAVSVDGNDEGDEIVAEELQPGYKIGDDIIRHAMVRVKMEKAK